VLWPSRENLVPGGQVLAVAALIVVPFPKTTLVVAGVMGGAVV
jgi:hypothetical protein